jgi:triacylglycerol esterase/lipase EstA (alpha/beta hydrolase family)
MTTLLQYICLSVKKYKTIGGFKIIDIYCHSAGGWDVLDQGSPYD